MPEPMTYHETVADVLRRVREADGWELRKRYHIRRWGLDYAAAPTVPECPITTETGIYDYHAFEITAHGEGWSHYDPDAVEDIVHAADGPPDRISNEAVRIRDSLLAAAQLQEVGP